jgi:lysophospholipase L1-like esterase
LRRRFETRLLLVLLLFAGPALISCGSSHGGQAQPSASSRPTSAPSSAVGTPTPAASASSSSTAKSATYYVSIGDSYAAGYQPIKDSLVGHTTTAGFAYQLAASATLRGRRLTLVNFGCGGVTSGGLLEQKGCLAPLEGPGAPQYPNQTQSQAALDFIQNHPGQVGLVTVSIGGNDITSCARSADLTGCMREKLPTLASNLTTFLGLLHTLAGPDVMIVGLTYPDVLLGGDLSKEPLSRALAPESVAAFKNLFNPTLKAAYDSIGATFVDVTAGTGAYLPSTQTTQLAPYGTIPVSVAKVCQLTYFCSQNDIHPRDSGYQVIAGLVAEVLPKS